MKTIYILGDSIFGRMKKSDLKGFDEKLRCRSINMAYSGALAKDMNGKYLWLAELNPELVILSAGINDANLNVDVYDFEESIEKLIKSFRNSCMLIIIPPPVDEISDKTAGQKFNQKLKPYADRLTYLSRKNENVILIDQTEQFHKLSSGNTSYHSRDGVHLNMLGYEVLYKKIAEALAS